MTNLENELKTEELRLILEERQHQRQRWGDAHDDGHGPIIWVALMTKYLGRAAATSVDRLDSEEYQKTLVAIGALSLSALRAHLEEQR